MTSTLSSSTAHEGDMVTMEAVDDALVGSDVVIGRGALIIGRVVKVKGAGRVGKGGKLGIAMESVKAVDGRRIALKSEIAQTGKGGYGAGSAVGVAATGFFFFPAGPLWLLKHGHDVEIPLGAIFTVATTKDEPVDASQYVPPSPAPRLAEKPGQSPQRTTILSTEAPAATAEAVQSESLGDVARRYRQQKQQ